MMEEGSLTLFFFGRQQVVQFTKTTGCVFCEKTSNESSALAPKIVLNRILLKTNTYATQTCPDSTAACGRLVWDLTSSSNYLLCQKGH